MDVSRGCSLYLLSILIPLAKLILVPSLYSVTGLPFLERMISFAGFFRVFKGECLLYDILHSIIMNIFNERPFNVHDSTVLRIFPPVAEGFVELNVRDHLGHSRVLFTAYNPKKIRLIFFLTFPTKNTPFYSEIKGFQLNLTLKNPDFESGSPSSEYKPYVKKK